MFAPRYFAPRYFDSRYWPPGAEVEAEIEAPIGTGGGGGIIELTPTGIRRDLNAEERRRREEIFARVRALFADHAAEAEPEAPRPIPVGILDALDDAKREVRALRAELRRLEQQKFEAEMASIEAMIAEAERLEADEDEALTVLLMMAL